MLCPKCGRYLRFGIFTDYHHPSGALSCEPVAIVLKTMTERS